MYNYIYISLGGGPKSIWVSYGTSCDSDANGSSKVGVDDYYIRVNLTLTYDGKTKRFYITELSPYNTQDVTIFVNNKWVKIISINYRER